jgi:hypothetical protein
VLGLPTEEVIDQHSTLDESTERIWTAHLAGAPSPWPRHAAQEPQ